MIRTRPRIRAAIAALAIGGWLAAAAPADAQALHQPTSKTHSHTHPPSPPGGPYDHDHPPVPAAYAKMHIPDAVWTDAKAIAIGKNIWAAKCAVCHGDRGDGKGPGAANLALKPADLTDASMVAEMPGNFWYWRVSEGGLAEPFKSKGSAMPAWKGELSQEERWAVIAYAHTLSGHTGPHVASEHPTLGPRQKLVTGNGTVVALRPEKQQVVLEHGPITGFMDAMTMGYKVSPDSLLQRVKPGDKVRFTIDTEARAITRLDAVKD